MKTTCIRLLLSRKNMKKICSQKWLPPLLSTIIPATTVTTASPKFCTDWQLKWKSFKNRPKLKSSCHSQAIGRAQLVFGHNERHQRPQTCCQHRVGKSHDAHPDVGVQVCKGQQEVGQQRGYGGAEHPGHIPAHLVDHKTKQWRCYCRNQVDYRVDGVGFVRGHVEVIDEERLPQCHKWKYGHVIGNANHRDHPEVQLKSYNVTQLGDLSARIVVPLQNTFCSFVHPAWGKKGLKGLQ